MYFEIAAEQIRFNTNASYFLLAWAVLNILVGLLFAPRFKKGGELRSFHQFNAVWNVVNLLIGAGSLLWMSRLIPGDMELKELIYVMFNFEKILLLNIGLDIAYVAVGFYLREMGMHHKKQTLIGFGQSLWLQGGFLFIFNLVLFVMNAFYNQKYAFFILF